MGYNEGMTHCPHCHKEINAGSLLGQMKSPSKSEAARLNGRKGGNPALLRPASTDARKAQATAPIVPPLAASRSERAPLFKPSGSFA